MSRESVATPAAKGLDWKALGYLVSIVSVFFLGAIAWPKPGKPAWHLPVLITGMVMSVIGMASATRPTSTRSAS
jgi:hypothetical protein